MWIYSAGAYDKWSLWFCHEGALGLCLAKIAELRCEHRLKVGQLLRKQYKRVSKPERERKGNTVEQC